MASTQQRQTIQPVPPPFQPQQPPPPYSNSNGGGGGPFNGNNGSGSNSNGSFDSDVDVMPCRTIMKIGMIALGIILLILIIMAIVSKTLPTIYVVSGGSGSTRNNDGRALLDNQDQDDDNDNDDDDNSEDHNSSGSDDNDDNDDEDDEDDDDEGNDDTDDNEIEDKNNHNNENYNVDDQDQEYDHHHKNTITGNQQQQGINSQFGINFNNVKYVDRNETGNQNQHHHRQQRRTRRHNQHNPNDVVVVVDDKNNDGENNNVVDNHNRNNQHHNYHHHHQQQHRNNETTNISQNYKNNGGGDVEANDPKMEKTRTMVHEMRPLNDTTANTITSRILTLKRSTAQKHKSKQKRQKNKKPQHFYSLLPPRVLLPENIDTSNDDAMRISEASDVVPEIVVKKSPARKKLQAMLSRVLHMKRGKQNPKKETNKSSTADIDTDSIIVMNSLPTSESQQQQQQQPLLGPHSKLLDMVHNDVNFKDPSTEMSKHSVEPMMIDNDGNNVTDSIMPITHKSPKGNDKFDHSPLPTNDGGGGVVYQNTIQRNREAMIFRNATAPTSTSVGALAQAVLNFQYDVPSKPEPIYDLPPPPSPVLSPTHQMVFDTPGNIYEEIPPVVGGAGSNSNNNARYSIYSDSTFDSDNDNDDNNDNNDGNGGNGGGDGHHITANT